MSRYMAFGGEGKSPQSDHYAVVAEEVNLWLQHYIVKKGSYQKLYDKLTNPVKVRYIFLSQKYIGCDPFYIKKEIVMEKDFGRYTIFFTDGTKLYGEKMLFVKVYEFNCSGEPINNGEPVGMFYVDTISFLTEEIIADLIAYPSGSVFEAKVEYVRKNERDNMTYKDVKGILDPCHDVGYHDLETDLFVAFDRNRDQVEAILEPLSVSRIILNYGGLFVEICNDEIEHIFEKENEESDILIDSIIRN